MRHRQQPIVLQPVLDVQAAERLVGDDQESASMLVVLDVHQNSGQGIDPPQQQAVIQQTLLKRPGGPAGIGAIPDPQSPALFAPEPVLQGPMQVLFEPFVDRSRPENVVVLLDQRVFAPGCRSGCSDSKRRCCPARRWSPETTRAAPGLLAYRGKWSRRTWAPDRPSPRSLTGSSDR